MKRYGLLLNTGFLAALSFAAVSCLEDELVESRLKSDSNAIGFGISAATKADGASLSSAPHYADSSLLMLGNGGADTLYLHASYQNNLSTVSSGKEPATRGVPVNNSNFSDACGNFAVSAFTPGGSPYMQNVRVDNLSGGIWSSDEKHFWPEEGDMALDFFACAPSEYTYGPEGSAVTVPVLAQDDIAFTTEKDSKKLEFDYTVPGSESGVTNAAERQPDIMFAYSACSRDNSSAGSVPLKFYHALAGVKFVAKDITGGTVKSITLKNLYGAGKCTYVFLDGNGGEPSITWNFDEQQQNASFSQEFNVKVNNQQTGEQEITDKAPETTFMMLPQDIENAEVEVLFNDGKTDYTLTGKLYDPSITSADNDTDLSTWDAGKIYTYAISTESINWTYVFEVSDNITFELGQTSEPYTVTSYRYRTQLGDKEENREPVPWTAANIGASETDPSNDKISSVDINDIVTAFTSNGDGSVKGAQSYTLGLVRGTLHTDYDGDKKLQDAKYKGSETAPYDLSTSNGVLSQETANCYAINAPGTYKLPLVYGNAIKNGSNNSVAYNNSAFTDYKGQRINNPYIYSSYEPGDACLVWSDGFYMFENVHLDEQKQWLIFSVNRDYMQQANAILAVRDKEGNIMWSWHIWVTERNLVGTAHTLQDWTNTSTTYGLLPCNLGWVDGKMVYYNSRELTYEFTQGTSGYKQTMLVNQAGAEFDYKDVGSTYYQWGRKDPIVALRNWDTYRFEDYRLHETSDPKYKYGIKPEQVPISTTIQNPNIYYTATNSNGTWNTNWCTSVISTLWDNSSNTTSVDKTTSVKTIYDPSPRGYKVPIPRAFSVFVKGNTYSGKTGQNSINGYQIQEGNYNQYRVKPNRDGSGDDIPLTATGQRADREGLEAYSSAEGKISEPGGLWAMYGVYYWTSGQVNSNKNAGYSLCIRHDKGSNEYYYTYGFSGAKTMARPVRCIEDR